MGTGLVAPQPVGDTGKAQQAGLIAPQIIQQVVPKYTPDGMRAKLQGQVDVEAIVMPDGTIGKARVVRSLDAASGLDESALTAARQSTFKPGTLDGTPVPVLVTMTFYFWLH
jgi:TonB family protein